MATVSLLKWLFRWAVAGLAAAVVLLAIFSVAPSSWHQYLEAWFVFLFPPSIILMAAEACQSWFTWCSAQYMLLASLLNVLLYAVVGAILWLPARMLSPVLGRGRAA